MQIGLICFGTISLIYCVFLIIKIFKNRRVIIFNRIENGILRLYFPKKGKYSISILGGYLNKDMGMSLAIESSEKKNKVSLKKCKLKYKIVYRKNKGFVYYTFFINKVGWYNIAIINSEFLELSTSNLKLNKMLFGQQHINPEYILIRGYIEIFEKIMLIFCLVIGLNSMLFGIFYNLFL